MATKILLFFITLVVLFIITTQQNFPTSYRLERAFPVKHPIPISELIERDTFRHRRLLQQSGVVDFPLEGDSDPYHIGLYYTKVQLGTPPRDYHVQIDTGSNVLWVNCKSCNGCPTSIRQHIPVEFYDSSSSSTSSLITCSDSLCSQASQWSECSKSKCTFRFQYGDGSGNSGYYVSDLMHLNTMGVDSGSSNSSAKVVFGCSTSETGNIRTDGVNGIFGFSQHSMSVISQLSSQGVAPDSFSHCLVGSGNGGGILVFGQIMDPNMAYTPLVQSRPHFSVNLQSISVKGQTLSIDPSTFSIPGNQEGTIIDSGTTLAYLPQDALTLLKDAISQAVSQSAQPVISREDGCYIFTSSVSSIFPLVSLNFQGGSSMHIRPQDYLLQDNSKGGAEVWCFGFRSYLTPGPTVLGDLVLKDKIIVYDLGGQRLGWSDYNCSSSVNVSSTSSRGRGGSSTSFPMLILASILQYAFNI
ncbi:aspartic peptidase A1 family [Artemisia annua]|uniref:Aspartic peptidase A1 family n=1 Tax=Artemisia annua TaxID=35608 RepID=A0A2U1MU04_ARTAN|nr:aspartic peptidase A1 family [Artemisia annua]